MRRLRALSACWASLLWVSVLKSGVHATLAGVVLALFIPLKPAGEAEAARPAIRLEHAMKPWVGVVHHAGLRLRQCRAAARPACRWRAWSRPLPLGIVAGLFLGKQLGIMLGAGLLIVLGIAAMPAGGSLAAACTAWRSWAASASP